VRQPHPLVADAPLAILAERLLFVPEPLGLLLGLVSAALLEIGLAAVVLVTPVGEGVAEQAAELAERGVTADRAERLDPLAPVEASLG
jgi:hypothetical protein